MQTSFEEADLIGYLTGYRCKECGCCLYFNSAGMCWCSSCNFHNADGDTKKTDFVFLAVPTDHPHVVTFGAAILDQAPTPAAHQ